MREQLLDDSKGLYLQKTRSTPECVFSGGHIPEGIHAVSLRQQIGDDTYVVWLSVGCVDDVIDAIERFDPDEAEPDPKVDVGSAHKITYGELRGRKQTCLVCAEEMEFHEHGFCFSRPISKGVVVWMHTDCQDRLCEGLERVWDYSSVLVAEQA